ncbi:hypothetical protein HCD_00575 [Helicobacter cetorum MIT 99-5656]|uniref:Uncharacterized protein n=1 Tax=Helicobacter cetorum (strain ATCC BAA-540 / CCUG 52418 / MIT 99-5656) TaxID=1163745 RepID=I0EQC8_HELCM|nr:hypothetical protein HCD_00575 [Helicobacter cetorum MIT 99-5656]
MELVLIVMVKQQWSSLDNKLIIMVLKRNEAKKVRYPKCKIGLIPVEGRTMSFHFKYPKALALRFQRVGKKLYKKLQCN